MGAALHRLQSSWHTSSALEPSAATVYLSGATPDGINGFVVGAYTRRDDAPLTNDRYTYIFAASAAGPLLMWWSDGSWYVGGPDDVGTRRGVVAAIDEAHMPESIESTWLGVSRQSALVHPNE